MLKKIQIKHSFLISLSFLFFLLFVDLFFWLIAPLSAQENDAIAIRVEANPDKYSAMRWYKEVKEFEGAPQFIPDIDGYEAIRDGRTVYVNAGNLNSSGVHFSNIYYISYSQNSNPGTADVFANMLKHWTFNTNLINPGDFGTCSISVKNCLVDTDCQDGFECRPDNKCYLPPLEESALTCWRDSNCPAGLYCSGQKAVVVRQTKRYANLADIRTLIMNFQEKNGYFPELLSGTYIPGVSLSTWPSWNLTLAEEVEGGEFPLDPINTMGNCPGFDPSTCWDDVNRVFGGTFNANNIAISPANSYFYGYTVDQVYSFSPDGIIYCPLDGGACHN